MKEYFKKGQIVPKRLKMVFTHRKAQAHFTFGCDVVVEGRTISAAETLAVCLIVFEVRKGIKRNNGTFQRAAYAFKDIRFDCTGALTAIGVISPI